MRLAQILAAPLLALLALALLGACATPSFVTVDTPVPASASDQRGDGVLRDKDGRPVRYDLLGQVLPEFEAITLTGAPFSTQALKGQWTVLAAWGVWCHDSRNDAEHIDALARAIEAEAGLGFLSVHVPFSAEHLDMAYRNYGSVDAFFEASDVSWPVIIDEDASIRERLQVAWTPTYLVVAPDMTVRAFRTDFSVIGAEAVTDFLRDVKALTLAQ